MVGFPMSCQFSGRCNHHDNWCFKNLDPLQHQVFGDGESPESPEKVVAILGLIYLNMVVQCPDFGCINGKQCQNHGFSVRYWVHSWLS